MSVRKNEGLGLRKLKEGGLDSLQRQRRLFSMQKDKSIPLLTQYSKVSKRTMYSSEKNSQKIINRDN